MKKLKRELNHDHRRDFESSVLVISNIAQAANAMARPLLCAAASTFGSGSGR